MTTGTIVLAVALLPIKGIWSALPDFPLSKRELDIRAGYYTEGGKYLGGIPRYDNEDEFYECTEFNSNNGVPITSTTDGSATSTGDGAESNTTVCTSWTTSEVAADEFEVGTCSCVSIANAEYCSAWTCSQLEVDNAITCSGSGGEGCFFEKELERTRCSCETEDEQFSGTFCAFWTCLERDSDGGQEFEEYQCVRASPSGEYCEAWTGVSESSEEVEVSSCECVEQLSGVGVCSYWECKERGLDKCSHASPSWCNIHVSVWVGGLFGSLGALVAVWGFLHLTTNWTHRNVYIYPRERIAAGFLWMAGWSVGVVIWGGQDGARYAGIWWSSILALGSVICCLVDCLRITAPVEAAAV